MQNPPCPNCKPNKPCPKHKILNQFSKVAPKVKLHFSGPSPPEIFVGRFGYPNINTGIMSPTTYDTSHHKLKDYEDWSKSNLSIANVLRLRGQLVYGRTLTNIKHGGKIKQVINELALTHKTTSTEFFLKKIPRFTNYTTSSILRPMTNPAPIKKVLLEENTTIHKKVDYLVNDSDVKATSALMELQNTITLDHMQKLLSAGLLGQKTQRKMVPTRWSITAVDDTVSKEMLKKIKEYEETEEIIVLKGDYLGNYIQVLLLPGKFSFEAIELWQDEEEKYVSLSKDFEGFFGRKSYASNVTGGYYAMKLPVCEYLEKIKKQATVVVIREITTKYYAPLGVGIVRETTRRAISSKPINFGTKSQALTFLKSNFLLKHTAIESSEILKNYGKQKSLKEYF